MKNVAFLYSVFEPIKHDTNKKDDGLCTHTAASRVGNLVVFF